MSRLVAFLVWVLVICLALIALVASIERMANGT